MSIEVNFIAACTINMIWLLQLSWMSKIKLNGLDMVNSVVRIITLISIEVNHITEFENVTNNQQQQKTKQKHDHDITS